VTIYNSKMMLINIRKVVWKMILLVLLFLIIYGLRLPVIYNSVTLVSMLLCIGLLFHRKARSRVHILVKDKVVGIVFLILICLLSWTIILPTLSGTNDYTLIRPFIGVIICFLTCFLWIIYYYAKNKDINQFLRSFVIVNVIQCIIMMLAFFSLEVREFIQIFQDPAVVEIGGFYSGIRGLALTPNAYFGLSYILAVAMLINNYLYFYDTSKRWSYVIFFVILFIGAMSAGRTAILGSVLSVFLLIYLSVVERKMDLLLKYIFKIMLIVFLIVISVSSFTPSQYLELISDRVLPFAFEFYYGYMENGTFQTASTDDLQHMYYAIKWGTFFIGDGIWTVENGLYYGNTDAGYMRNILFMGIFGTVGLFSYIYIMIRSIIIYSKLLPGRIDILIIFCTIWALVTHYKGEIIGYPNMTNVHFYLIFLFVRLYIGDKKTTKLESSSSNNLFNEIRA